MDDSELVRRFKTGDMSAFEELVLRHQSRLFRLAGLFLYNTNNIEDAVQEVFVRAYRGLPRFQFRSQPFTWLYRTLFNVCEETNRKEKKHPDIPVLIPDYNRNPEEALGDSQVMQKVVKELENLSRRERDVVLLRVFEEFTTTETARTLGIRDGTVKALLHRGLRKMKSSGLLAEMKADERR